MACDQDALTTALAGTPLCDAAILSFDDPADVLVLVPTERAFDLETWRLLRSLVPRTGRWPVATTGDGSGDWLLAPSQFALEGIRAAPDQVWPWSTWVDDLPVRAEDVRLGEPLDAMLRRDLSSPTTRPVLDRWLYERYLDSPALRGPWTGSPRLVSTEVWYQPQDQVAYALMPTDCTWEAQAWLSFFGALGEDRPRLLAAEREWSERWGAELVASWETMLQFIVTRPPTDPEDCWHVAGQLLAVGGSLSWPRYDLALALPHGQAWFLHDRP